MKPFFILMPLLLFLLIAGQGAHGQGAPERSFPGIAEVVPQAARLADEEARARGRIAFLRDSLLVEQQVQSARERQELLDHRFRELGDPALWNIDRLQEMRSRLAEQRDSLQGLLEEVSNRLVELDSLRRAWIERRDFWQQWEEHLREASLEYPADNFGRARSGIDAVLGLFAEGFSPLLKQQGEVTALHERNLESLHHIDLALDTLRGDIFRRTAPPFSHGDFHRQFDGDIFLQMRGGLVAVQEIPGDWLREHGWLIAFQSLVVLGTGILIRRQRSSQATREWRFILKHPWATGIFVSTSSLSFLYSAPPAPWRLLLWGLAAFSVAVLTTSLLRNPRKILIIQLLAALFVLSLALQIIAFPQPLYRLYLASISLAGIPLLLVLASRNRRAHEGKKTGFTFALQVGVVILGLSFFAQFGGYHLLASRLVESSVETVFVILFVAMAVRLGHGAIELLFESELVQRRDFFRRFGPELIRHFKRLFEALAVGYSFLYLLVVWGFFGNVADGWGWITGAGFSLGEARVSMQMILLVGVVLYASIMLSWIIRALLDSEVFPHQSVERGVAEAIKKLLHYALILIGFLLALSLAGIELGNLAVLAGAFGIGIGFGLQNIVNNFVSGLILLFERPVKVGDVIVLGAEWGIVRRMGLRSTVVETFDQSEIIVPNSDLISEKVTNWTLTNRMARVILPVGVAYGSDVRKVMTLLMEVAAESGDVQQDPPPTALFLGFGDSSLDFELRVWIADVSRRLKIKSDLGQGIDRKFREEGVEIPFPQRDLHVRSIDEALLRRLNVAPKDTEKPAAPPGGDAGPVRE